MRRPRAPIWTPDEVATLKAMIDEGKTLPEIASALGRTLEATRVRAYRYRWYAYPSRRFNGRPPTATGGTLAGENS